eukprot:gene30263-36570_t
MVNIVLRIRTNLGVKRLTIDENASISSLTEEVTRLFNIISAIPLVLSMDLEGNRLLNADLSISGQNILNGGEIFVLGRFKNMRVEKTTINEQHEVIKAGDYYELIEPPNITQHIVAVNTIEQTEELGPVNGAPITANQQRVPTSNTTSTSSLTSKPTSSKSQSNAVLSEPSSIIPPSAIATTADKKVYDHDSDDDQEEVIRPADEAQRMVLLDEGAGFHSGPVARLTEEEEQQVRLYVESLRGAGLGEWQVQQEAVTFSDELLTKRIVRQEQMQRKVFMTPLSDLQGRLDRSQPALRLAPRNQNTSASTTTTSNHTIPVPSPAVAHPAPITASMYPAAAVDWGMMARANREEGKKGPIEGVDDVGRQDQVVKKESSNKRPSKYRNPTPPDIPEPSDHDGQAASLLQKNMQESLNLSFKDIGYAPFEAFRSSSSAPSKGSRASNSTTVSGAARSRRNVKKEDDAATKPPQPPRISSVPTPGASYAANTAALQQQRQVGNNDHVRLRPGFGLALGTIGTIGDYIPSFASRFNRDSQHLDAAAVGVPQSAGSMKKNEANSNNDVPRKGKRVDVGKTKGHPPEEARPANSVVPSANNRTAHNATNPRAAGTTSARRDILRGHLHDNNPLPPSLAQETHATAEEEMLQMAIMESMGHLLVCPSHGKPRGLQEALSRSKCMKFRYNEWLDVEDLISLDRIMNDSQKFFGVVVKNELPIIHAGK